MQPVDAVCQGMKGHARGYHRRPPVPCRNRGVVRFVAAYTAGPFCEACARRHYRSAYKLFREERIDGK